MVIPDLTVDLFPFIGSGHPFYPHIQQCKTLLCEHPRYRDAMEKTQDGEHLSVRITMKTAPLENQGWKLKRICLSFQSQDPSTSTPFQAITFLYSGKKQQLECYEFPQDPCLTEITSLLSGMSPQPPSHDTATSIRVLRYIPRRRLTFQTAPIPGYQEPMIGKCLRPADLKDAYEKLVQTSRSVNRACTSFSVAAPRGIDEERHIFFQEVKEGTVLSSLLDETTFRPLLFSVGALHKELHRLEVPDVPSWNAGLFLHDLRTHIDWLAFFLPEHKAVFDHLWPLLLNQVPVADSNAFTFCHGDFNCNHILLGHDRWAMVDFDGCLRGDPHWEMAMLLASLPYHIPLFQGHGISNQSVLEQASESYIRGYEERGHGSVDCKRLFWFRICAEIIYLTRTLRRNLFQPVTFEQRIQFLLKLGEGLRKNREFV